MASTYSSLKIELIGTGDQTGDWGNTTNTNLGTALEEAITSSTDVVFAGATVTLTLTDTNASQTARHLRLNLTGTSSGLQNLIVPSIQKLYIIYNGCADTITVKNSTGTGIGIPTGKTSFVYNNGVNVLDAVTYLTSLSAGTLTTTGAASLGSTLAVAADGTFSGTGQVKLPAGTTGQRSGSPTSGMLRFNNTTGSFEGYDGTAWGGIGGAQAGGAISINNKTASSSYTITASQNGFSVGPITIADGVTVTIADTSVWVII